MTDRERITEILKAYTKKHNIMASSVILEEYAEELLANGVIVPPCKVGDTVYYPWIYDGQCGIAFSKVESIKIYVNGLPIAVVEDWKSDMPNRTLEKDALFDKAEELKAEVERLKNAYKQVAWERDIFAQEEQQPLKRVRW